MMMRLLTLVFAALLSVAAYGVAVDEKPLTDPAQEALARELMKEIRCLVCQNQSIEDSNADLAKDLRMIVRERIALGDTADNVRAYLVDRYGDWVLLEPPVNTSTYLLWISPFLLLLLVGFAVVGARRKSNAPAPLSESEREKLQALLKDNGDDS